MSFYRAAVFGIRGFSEFTRSGYESAVKKFNPDDTNVDMSKEYVMITGANSVKKFHYIFSATRIDKFFLIGYRQNSSIRMCETSSARVHGVS